MLGIVVVMCGMEEGVPSARWEMNASIRLRLFLLLQEEEGKLGNGN